MDNTVYEILHIMVAHIGVVMEFLITDLASLELQEPNTQFDFSLLLIIIIDITKESHCDLCIYSKVRFNGYKVCILSWKTLSIEIRLQCNLFQSV